MGDSLLGKDWRGGQAGSLRNLEKKRYNLDFESCSDMLQLFLIRETAEIKSTLNVYHSKLLLVFILNDVTKDFYLR